MTKRVCAICKRPAEDAAYVPFCSKRCADLDLQRWFSGAYAVPGVEAEEDGWGGRGRGWTERGRSPIGAARLRLGSSVGRAAD